MAPLFTPPPDDLSGQAALSMTRARSRLVLEHPFFGSLALRLRFKEDPGCRDLWTDGVCLGFNPAYAATLPREKLVGAQAHEILHLAFGHHLRRGNRDKALWNRACDLAVNHILLEAGFALPAGFAHDPDHADASAEDIYEALARLREDSSKRGRADAGQEESVPDDDGAGSTGFAGGLELGGRQAAQGSAAPEDRRKDDKAGAGGLGRPSPSAQSKASPSEEKVEARFTGEVRDHPGASGLNGDAARKAAEREADIALNQAMQRALHMGDAPAGFSRLVKQRRRPVLDWRELLRRFLSNCADNDYSWTTPNRRYLHQDLYLPSRSEARLPPMALAVDCSGSVDQGTLADFCAELSSVLEAYDTVLTVLFHDSKVQDEKNYCRMDLPLHLTPLGGGGTDFRPVCGHIAEQRLNPACLVWFTDLECNRFPEAPEYPVLWVCSRPRPTPPPFGELICLAAEAGADPAAAG